MRRNRIKAFNFQNYEQLIESFVLFAADYCKSCALFLYEDVYPKHPFIVKFSKARKIPVFKIFSLIGMMLEDLGWLQFTAFENQIDHPHAVNKSSFRRFWSAITCISSVLETSTYERLPQKPLIYNTTAENCEKYCSKITEKKFVLTCTLAHL